MNAGAVQTNESNFEIQQTQDQVNTLQQQVVIANIIIAQTDSAYQNLANLRSRVDVARSDNFYGKNIHSWLQSIESYFAAQRVELSEQSKVRCVVSYMYGEELQ